MRDDPRLQGEDSNWKDTGCEFHPHCLDCPLEVCAEMKPRGPQQRRLQLRAAAMKKMRRRGNGVHEVATAFGVCVRTVQREMKMRRRIKK
jgi:hypothetical protein